VLKIPYILFIFKAKFAGGATNDNSATFKNNFTATDTIEVIGK